MKQLPCDNLQEFVDGNKHFYSVDKDSGYRRGQQVILYNGDRNETFEINYVHYFKENEVLALRSYPK